MSSDLSELKRTQGVEVGHKITECSEVLQNQVYKNPGSGSFFDSKDKGCVDTRIKKHIRADEVWMFPELTWIFFFFDIDKCRKDGGSPAIYHRGWCGLSECHRVRRQDVSQLPWKSESPIGHSSPHPRESWENCIKPLGTKGKERSSLMYFIFLLYLLDKSFIPITVSSLSYSQ